MTGRFLLTASGKLSTRPCQRITIVMFMKGETGWASLTLMEAATQTTRPQPRTHTLVHFEIPVNDPAKLSRFYEQLFGWKFTKMPTGDTDYWLISHKDAAENETMGGLYKRIMGEIGYINYFSVVNLDQSLGKAASLGANVIKGKQEIPDIGWFAILQDPDNNTFALFQGKGM